MKKTGSILFFTAVMLSFMLYSLPAAATGLTRIEDGVYSYVNYIAAEILKAVPKGEFFEMFVAGNVSAKYLQAKKQ